MPRDKIKPPAKSKAELMVIASVEIQRRKVDPIEFLLNFFTAADLVGIIEELENNHFFPSRDFPKRGKK